MVTISDIARSAGVSPGVVSRIVNGDKNLRVSKETRARVEAIIEETGYKPNVAARSLRKAKSGVIALVVHDITTPVYSEIVAGAQEAAIEHGKIVWLGDADSLGGNVAQLENLIAGGGVDGLILQGAGTELDRAIEHAVSRKLPLVFLQSGDVTSAPVLRMNDEAAGYLATKYLLECGHKNISIISTQPDLQFSQARLSGWRKALEESEIVVRDNMVSYSFSNYKSGYLSAQSLLEVNPDMTAIVVSNVLAAVGALAFFYDIGKRIPADISIVGINDTDITEFVRPALTCVKMPLREMGREAVNMICRDVNLTVKEELQIAEPEPVLTIRSSVAKL